MDIWRNRDTIRKLGRLSSNHALLGRITLTLERLLQSTVSSVLMPHIMSWKEWRAAKYAAYGLTLLTIAKPANASDPIAFSWPKTSPALANRISNI